MRQRHAGVWRQGRNTSLDGSGAEIRVEQRGGETVIEFARSGEAQGEFLLLYPFVCLFDIFCLFGHLLKETPVLKVYSLTICVCYDCDN